MSSVSVLCCESRRWPASLLARTSGRARPCQHASVDTSLPAVARGRALRAARTSLRFGACGRCAEVHPPHPHHHL